MANIPKTSIVRLEKNVDIIVNKVANMEKNVAVLVAHFADHVKKDEILEAVVKHINQTQLPPLRKHVDRVGFLVKCVPYVLGLAAAAVAIIYKTGGISLF